MPDQEADEFVVSDPELITRVRTGDREAFGELYKRHSGAATTLSRQFARTATESDDLVSESFARVLDNLLAGKGPDTAFRAYLFTAIRNTAYDRTRKDKRLQFTDDMTAHDIAVVGDDPVLAKMESGLIATAFAKLPERWQAVLWHTQVEGETPGAGRRVAGDGPGAVSSLAFRAREGLREAYLQAHLAETAAEQCRTTVERLGRLDPRRAFQAREGAGRRTSGGRASAAARWPLSCRRSTTDCVDCWRRYCWVGRQRDTWPRSAP